jgi:hypothetical protein
MVLNTVRRWYHSIYMGRYFKLCRGDQQDLHAWLLPVAAGRLSEDIPEEKDRLLKLVRGLAK